MRLFSCVLTAFVLLGQSGFCQGPATKAGPSRKAHFNVLYSNDLTNVIYTPSPYNHPTDFSEEMLRASVDETAGTGVDVHLLQPGLGWVPLWQSKILPMAEHLQYQQESETHDATASINEYVAGGGDVVKVFVEECRTKKIAPFISMRMNDGHHIIHASWGNDPSKRAKETAEFKYYADHPEYRIGPDITNAYYQNLFDWAHPEVRNYKLSFIKEIIDNYDIDGFELDYERAPYFFRKSMPVNERRAIMVSVIKEVRAALNRTTAPGKHRWLGVRIPGYTSRFDDLGIDLKAWTAAGVEIINVSGFNFTDQQLNISAIRRQVPDNVAVYNELHYVSSIAKKTFGTSNYELRQTTDAEFYTTAHLAHARGADGMSIFNFVYFRAEPHVEGSHEPPFHVLGHLADRKWLAQQPQVYFANQAWEKAPGKEGHLPPDFHVGVPHAIALDMMPPAQGWKKPGRLRVQGIDALGNRAFNVSLNGVALEPSNDVSEMTPNPYAPLLNAPENFLAWDVPASALRKGANTVDVVLMKGEPIQIFYLDIQVP